MRFSGRKIFACFLFVVISFISFKSFANSFSDSSKQQITIAFIFPFNTAKVYITDLEESKYFFPDETQIASEFLQGAFLAIDSLKQQGLNAKILVYDSGNDSLTIKKVLRIEALKNADLIFSPFSGYALKAVASFGEKEKISVVSPLSVSFSETDSNQFLILGNASLKTHCERMYDYMLTSAFAHRTLMVYRKRPQDLEIVTYFKQYAAKKKSEGSSTLKFVELTDSSKTTFWNIKDSVFMTDVNHILVASTDEPSVRTLIKQLSNLQDIYKMKVYGMPTWRNFDLIPGEQLDSLNTVITSPIWLDKTKPEVENFKNKYVTKFQVNPSEFSVRGYDQAFYFISELMKNDSLTSQLRLEKDISMLATSFHFGAPEAERNSFLENQGLFLLTRKDGKWILLNK